MFSQKLWKDLFQWTIAHTKGKGVLITIGVQLETACNLAFLFACWNLFVFSVLQLCTFLVVGWMILAFLQKRKEKKSMVVFAKHESFQNYLSKKKERKEKGSCKSRYDLLIRLISANSNLKIKQKEVLGLPKNTWTNLLMLYFEVQKIQSICFRTILL